MTLAAFECVCLQGWKVAMKAIFIACVLPGTGGSTLGQMSTLKAPRNGSFWISYIHAKLGATFDS